MVSIKVTSGPRIGYVLKRFPRLSETFILNELLALERMGVDVEVFALLHPENEPRHELLKSLRARVSYLPRKRAIEAIEIAELKGGEVVPTTFGAKLSAQSNRSNDITLGLEPRKAATLELQGCVLAQLAASRGITHLHAHFCTDATTVAMIASRSGDATFSFTAHAKDIYHTYVSPEVDAAILRRKLAAARFAVTVSDYNCRHLINVGGPTAFRKVHRLYNGIDLNRFCPGPGASRDRGHILSVARLVEKKGISDLVAACHELDRQGFDFRCTIVGDGPLKPSLADQIAGLGLAGKVVLAGAKTQADVLALMRRATVFALPCVISASGDRDGLPTVLLEALGAGLPCVSTRVAGIPEIIDHEQSGLLVPPADPIQLAHALGRILGDAKLASRFAQAGRSKAMRSFDLESNVGQLAALLRGGERNTATAASIDDAYRVYLS